MKKQTKRFLIFTVCVIISSTLFLLLWKNSKFKKIEEPNGIISSGKFKKGDTLYETLIKENITLQEAFNIIKALSKKYHYKNIKPGDSYKLVKSTTNEFISFSFSPNIFEEYKVEKSSNNEYVCIKEEIKFDKKISISSGVITSDLYTAMVNAGFPASFPINFANIFAWQIDFLTEVREGDIYKVVYEKIWREGEFVTYGKILAAKYIGKYTTEHTAILFEDAYYDEEGRSLAKAFLRAPLQYTRITSKFTYRRLHPILRVVRPHLGIDYAAPQGSPVSAVADGVVEFCGWRGGLGKTVIIRHGSVYKTWYGHLSKFAKGMKKNKKVKQGEVIGYVGSTGLATGPHLDFRIQQNGKFVDFLKINFPPKKKLKGEKLSEFRKLSGDMLKLLSNI